MMQSLGFGNPNGERSDAGEQGGGLLLGRRTYEQFYSVWPKRKDNPFTEVLDRMHKYVASRTLQRELPWVNSTLLEGDAVEAIRGLKKKAGARLVMRGSGELIQSLMRAQLVDEFVLLILRWSSGRVERVPCGGVAANFFAARATAARRTAAPRAHRPFPLQTYARCRDLRQAPGRAAQATTMTKHAVVIAGGGPTGLMLAAELALAGVDVAIVERRETQELAGSRAGGLHSRTIEVLDQRGVAERFLSQGKTMQVAGFALSRLDIGDFPTRHNYGLALWQSRIEVILAAWVDELGVPIYRGRDVTDFVQDDAGVVVELSDGRSLEAAYLVGCDGGRSVIRKRAGIDFAGWDASVSYLIAEVAMTEEPASGIRRDAKGIHAMGKLEDGIRVRVVSIEPEVRQGDEPMLDDLREALVTVYGTDFGVHDVTWLSRFTDTTRQAASYRERRVLLAGDAAHIHSPAGGQGLNIGIQDAVNLGWKLAQVVNGTSPESLLDTYHAERHPIGARVLRTSMAQTAVNRGDERTTALRDSMTELLAMDEPRKRYAAMMSGLDVHYDLGDGHPLLGRRMPDLDLVTESGPRRVFTFLHAARPILLDLGEPGTLDVTPWADHVQRIDARYAGAWELPVLGAVPAPAAVLIRPDGYVAWVGNGTDQGLGDALSRWFGAPSVATAR
ncbi:MAG TPA: FAD-dependent monooxygenase [Polyangiaceae bacterium]|jgi:2-polyprenyl-6-methoxyphenol hydroxylase-like FAD-dependent oxidoreductase/dihydrofolate reductase|nr:FAD-dependent monooxygenase [Polyangiaceae bacterium]